MKKVFLIPLKSYQYISKMLPANCRYYPTCSEYASWQFEFNTPSSAFIATSLRILKCNQFFKGGIDYPLVKIKDTHNHRLLFFNPYCGKIDILYWLVPKNRKKNNKYYFIVKDFNAIKRTS